MADVHSVPLIAQARRAVGLLMQTTLSVALGLAMEKLRENRAHLQAASGLPEARGVALARLAIAELKIQEAMWWSNAAMEGARLGPKPRPPKE